MNTVRKITDTVIWRVMQWFGVLFIFTTVLNLSLDFFEIGFDDTDGGSRSGMGVLIDARTGCQYLYTPDGGLTPRLTRDGSQICE